MDKDYGYDFKLKRTKFSAQMKEIKAFELKMNEILLKLAIKIQESEIPLIYWFIELWNFRQFYQQLRQTFNKNPHLNQTNPPIQLMDMALMYTWEAKRINELEQLKTYFDDYLEWVVRNPAFTQRQINFQQLFLKTIYEKELTMKRIQSIKQNAIKLLEKQTKNLTSQTKNISQQGSIIAHSGTLLLESLSADKATYELDLASSMIQNTQQKFQQIKSKIETTRKRIFAELIFPKNVNEVTDRFQQKTQLQRHPHVPQFQFLMRTGFKNYIQGNQVGLNQIKDGLKLVDKIVQYMKNQVWNQDEQKLIEDLLRSHIKLVKSHPSLRPYLECVSWPEK